MYARLAFGLAAAACLILLAVPLELLARAFGRRSGPFASVAFHRLLCAALGVRVSRLGGAPCAGAPRLIVANHVSWLDIPVLGAIEPLTFLAKKEIGGNFLGRRFALLQGVVFVDRQQKRGIPAVNLAMARAMRSGEAVVLFAEATTSDGTRLLRFRSSHFEAARQAGAGTVVQPVYMDFCRVGGLGAGRAERASVAWYGDMTFLPSLRRVLRCGGVRCEVHYGEPIAVDPGVDRKALARATERAMRGLRNAARRGGPGAAAR